MVAAVVRRIKSVIITAFVRIQAEFQNNISSLSYLNVPCVIALCTQYNANNLVNVLCGITRNCKSKTPTERR